MDKITAADSLERGMVPLVAALSEEVSLAEVKTALVSEAAIAAESVVEADAKSLELLSVGKSKASVLLLEGSISELPDSTVEAEVERTSESIGVDDSGQTDEIGADDNDDSAGMAEEVIGATSDDVTASETVEDAGTSEEISVASIEVVSERRLEKRLSLVDSDSMELVVEAITASLETEMAEVLTGSLAATSLDDGAASVEEAIISLDDATMTLGVATASLEETATLLSEVVTASTDEELVASEEASLETASEADAVELSTEESTELEVASDPSEDEET